MYHCSSGWELIAGSLLARGLRASAYSLLLSLCSPSAYVVILGGTAPLSSVLFDYGVSAVSGTQVTDPESVLHFVSQGATFRQLKGIRLLTLTKSRS